MNAPIKIEDLKQELKGWIPEGIGTTLQEMKHKLPASNQKYNELIQLEAKLKEVNRQHRSGMIDFETLQRTYANIRAALLELIDSLEPADFTISSATPKTQKKNKRGSVLYQIPSIMELNKETRCRVRLAYLEELLLENIEITEDTRIQSIRIAEVMAVELLDPSPQPAFQVRNISKPEQFLDEDDYNEWLFYVKPLKEGVFPLMLKVCVIEEVRGRERVREIVLEEKVEIVTAASKQDTPFQTTDYQFSKVPSKAQISPAAPQTATNRSLNTFRKYGAVLALLLVFSIGAWAVDAPREIAWQVAQSKATPEAYRQFIDKYEAKGTKHIESAYFEKAVVASEQLEEPAAAIEEFQEYLEKYETPEKVEEVEELYFNKVIQVASLQQNVRPLTEFMVDYGLRNETYKAKAKAKVLEVAEVTEDEEQLREFVEKVIKAPKSTTTTTPPEQTTPEVLAPEEVIEEAPIEEDFVSIIDQTIEEITEKRVAVKEATAGRIEKLEAFIQKFPSSQRSKKVRESLQQIKANRIQTDNTEQQPDEEEASKSLQKVPSVPSDNEANKEKTAEEKPTSDTLSDTVTSEVTAPKLDTASSENDTKANRIQTDNTEQQPDEEEASKSLQKVPSVPSDNEANKEKTAEEKPTSDTLSDTVTSEVTAPKLDTASSENDTKADVPAPKQPERSDIPIPEMVFVKGGKFTMGCLDGRDTDCADDEKLAHDVTLKDFYIGKYEVTNEQFAAFLNDYGSAQVKSGEDEGEAMIKAYKWGVAQVDDKWQPAEGYGQYPVVKVNWYGANEYAKWLSEKTGKRFYLPSEAQWEYAARGGQKSQDYQYAGSNNIEEVAWYDDNANATTQLVGSKKQNELGLYDMSGNVFEWCADYWHEDYKGAPTNGAAWTSGGDSGLLVVRGGSWYINAVIARSSFRVRINPFNSINSVGFRVVRY